MTTTRLSLARQPRPRRKTVQPQIAAAPAPAATDQSLSAQQAAAAQAQIDSLQQQIHEMKESSVKETAFGTGGPEAGLSKTHPRDRTCQSWLTR